MPPGDAGYSSKASACHRVPHDGGGAGLHLRVNDNYVDRPLVILMAWACFLWTDCGLTPAQVVIRAQLWPASRSRRTW